jgi:hypothetical protein
VVEPGKQLDPRVIRAGLRECCLTRAWPNVAEPAGAREVSRGASWTSAFDLTDVSSISWRDQYDVPHQRQGTPRSGRSE